MISTLVGGSVEDMLETAYTVLLVVGALSVTGGAAFVIYKLIVRRD